ncbi:MAG: alpha-L-fucosidase [Bacteroidota bacterium]
MNIDIKKIVWTITLIGLSNVYGQKKYTADWESIDSRPVPEWFTSAKFGIFIHWGVYSVPSWAPVGKEYDVYSKYAEWYWKRLVDDTTNVGAAFRAHHLATYGPGFKYPDFANQFKAELFKPDQWAALFAASGAKYVVLTSKHHEGFTLWPSAQSWNWNSMDVGPHRDLAGDLMKAVKAKGLKMGYYYSLYEWFNPLYHADINRYVNEHMLPQMKDLVTRYKPDILWTDGEWEAPSSTWKSTEFLSWLYNDSPVKDVIAVNDRWGKETRGHHGGYYTTEYDLIDKDNAKDKKITHPWEECRGIGGSFGLNRNENLEQYSTADELIKLLIEKVSKGGNLLLDIGPAADGTIPVIMQQRLTDMGKWLKINGEAIYDSGTWDNAPPQKDSGLYFTRNGNTLYVLCTGYPANPIVVSHVRRPKRVTLLGIPTTIAAEYKHGTLTIRPPLAAQPDTVTAFVIKIENTL